MEEGDQKQSLVSEIHALRRKLHSKTEALLIISKDLDETQKERDQFKVMAERLRVRCQAYKRQFTDYPITKDQATLLRMLQDARNQKVSHQKQNEILQQKLTEALGDVKLLRERFARQRIGDEGIGPRHFPAHEREKLVAQLEDAKQLADQYRTELGVARDQLSEVLSEKAEVAAKCERLNEELNFMLNGDKKRIIDVDALCMENKLNISHIAQSSRVIALDSFRYLQERAKQCQDEKNSLHAQLSKMKTLLNSRKCREPDLKAGSIRNSGLVFSPKQIKQYLRNAAGESDCAETRSDLQAIASALLETINDKNLALHHLRNTNKILGKRIADLELKSKNLEAAGLRARSVTSDSELDDDITRRLSRLSDACESTFKEVRRDVTKEEAILTDGPEDV